MASTGDQVHILSTPRISWLFIVAFVTLAGAGYITPVMAAVLHVVSGLAVVFNSARLVRCGEDIEQQEATDE